MEETRNEEEVREVLIVPWFTIPIKELDSKRLEREGLKKPEIMLTDEDRDHKDSVIRW